MVFSAGIEPAIPPYQGGVLPIKLTKQKVVLGTGIEPVSNGYQPFVLTYCTNLVLNWYSQRESNSHFQIESLAT